MNDLDDLIRTSLVEHTSAGTPDDTLAERVEATGRRIRRQRRVAGITASLVAVAGLGWGATLLPHPAQPGIAASPSPVPSSSSPTSSAPPSPSQTPSTTLVRPNWDPTATTRDVSSVGEQIEYSAADIKLRETRVSFFSSPSGKFWCSISTEFANCDNNVEMPGIEPTREQLGCDDGVVEGVEVNTVGRGAWWCGSDQTQYPQLNDPNGWGMSVDGTLWWDAQFGQTRPGLQDPSYTLAVLPYGKTLTAGDFSCTPETSGVTCTNARTKHGFRISQSAVKLF
ncbi:hypothetical protein ATK74_0292 [Propionicimonas paludicola]|uniref:Uncharacterized protein n=1 Tax=Propionicimonas paludicola TaxID=185243 RepID=A0A2A9CQ86_9ACTN|nr:hypothetical protein [Propionicimonas paludicola]PFG15772.1 hypothetical protein ATK74_0292 [Propionicimonas paludicola]